MRLLTIGQVAAQAGISVDAVRFYERQGLLAPPPRSPAGYRQYPPDTVDRLRFVQRAKAVGFTLADIGELLTLRRQPGSSCGDIKRRTADKIAEVDAKLAELNRIRDALARMLTQCGGRGPLRDCPILAALDADDAP